MSDISDLETRMNQKIQDLNKGLGELKVLIATLTIEHTKRLDDLTSKSDSIDTEIRKIHEKLDRVQASADDLSRKLNS